MKSLKILIVIFCTSAIFSLQSFAQGISAQVSAKRVQVGERFEFAVVISGPSSNYNQPHFKDFDVVSGPNQSNSVQYVNGVMSQQMVFSYILVARREGKLTIPSANAMVNGQKLSTQPVAMEVVKGASGTAQAGGGDTQKEDKIDGTDLFIKTSVSKSKCYVGEQIVIVQKVYSRHQIVGYQRSVQPSYDGFYSQAQESPTKGQLVMENVDGVNYFTHEVIRTLATANKVGKISLGSMEADVVVRRQTNARPRNIFEQFFGAAGYEDVVVQAKSRPATVEVMPLPDTGKPENFDGAVGAFSTKVEASRTELKANDAFNLKITVTGKGNLKLINAPKLQLPEAFESYEPKTSESGNSKTFDYLIIPRQEGTYTLANFDFSYFSLETKKYVVLPSPEIKITVLPAAANSGGAQVYSPQSQIKESENDIRYIKKGDFELSKSETEFFNSSRHLFFLFLPVVALFGALLIRSRYLKNNSDIILVRERKAAKMAQKQLLLAEKMMKADKKDEFYTEVLLALNNYLSYRLNIPVADLSKDKVQAILSSKNVNQAVKEKLFTTLSTSEYAKYAPGAVSADLRSVYSDTVDLITKLEQELSKKNA